MRLDPVKIREAIAHGSDSIRWLFENERFLFDLPILTTFQEIVLGHAQGGDSFEFCRELAVSSSISILNTLVRNRAWVKSILDPISKKQIPSNSSNLFEPRC